MTLNTSLELLNIMESDRSVPVHNEWKKSFHDELDASSERSDAGLITEDPSRRWSERRVWHPSVRLVVECILVVIVVGLSASLVMQKMREHGRLTPYGPSLPTKKVIFGNAAGIGPELVYADNEMLWNATRLREVHENWQALFPKGRGYVIVDESKADFIVHNPAFNIDRDGKIGTTDGQGKGWILSVYHQLHCLSIIQSRMGIPHSEFATWDDYHLNHVSHCFEYLRQAILCNADTSLEGETGAASTSTGWGQMHVCKDFDSLLQYGDDHAAWDLSQSRVIDLHSPPGTTGTNKTTY